MSRGTNHLEQTIRIDSDAGVLEGTLTLPPGAMGLVLFAHGSGSSRHSPRNHFVAQALHHAVVGTLLFDLLTRSEEELDAQTAHLRFDIELLADRLQLATDWIVRQELTRRLPLGYFGASTGAAAALVAAAERTDIAAVVSRGGRPDLAGDRLRHVRAATLFLVGSRDIPVIEMNRDAFDRLTQCRDKELLIIPGASHLFEEPGTLDEVATLAARWFRQYLHRL
jgi:dienelactone hydrolase